MRRGVELELGERLALGYSSFHIASSREQAIREAAPHYEENAKMFGELRLVRALTDEQIAAMCNPRLVGTVKLRLSHIFDSGVRLRVELIESRRPSK